MRHLIDRYIYIKEYLHISNHIENERDNELYEGLLGTLFGGLKMLLKKDWAGIKCKNPSVLKYLQEIDKSLSGYTMTKMQFSDECKIIRQNVADYFNDILDYKLSQLEKVDDADKFIKKENKEREENEDDDNVEKELNLKDKTLLDSISKYKENINTACKPSAKLKEYANQMLNSVEVFVNDIILSELEKKGVDKEKLEEERKKNEEKRKKLKAIQNKMNKLAKNAGEEALKKLAKDRDKALTNLGVKPIGAMNGDKAIDAITKDYARIINELKNTTVNESLSIFEKNFKDLLKGDVYLGLQNSLESIKWREDDENDVNAIEEKLYIKVILYKINTIFKVISKNKGMFVDVPAASVQAMMVGLANAVIYGFMSGEKFDNTKKDDSPILTILTKCAIDSDATIGFNLPLLDPKKPDNGNFFVSIMGELKGSDIKSSEVGAAIESLSGKESFKLLKKSPNITGYNKEEVKKYKAELVKKYSPMMMKEFKQHMTDLFDRIIKKAKDLKEAAAKERANENTNDSENN